MDDLLPSDSDRRSRLAALRRSYARSTLSEHELAPDPFTQFQLWFDDAVRGGLTEPNAMVLATAAPDGAPSARIVLLKGMDGLGFVLYTNHGSRKGREMLANPRASLVFPWFEIDRQVLVEGRVHPVDRRQTAHYFRTRPHDSQIGAWASDQSAVIENRSVLEDRFAELSRRWPPGTDVPVPDHWGGFRVVPSAVEFWQGRPSRLHDRLRYRRPDPAERVAGEWVVERLAP